MTWEVFLLGIGFAASGLGRGGDLGRMFSLVTSGENVGVASWE